MTALEFLRCFAGNHSRTQLSAVAATIAAGILVLSGTVLEAGLPAWAGALTVTALVTAYLAAVWYALGVRRVQRWITGESL